jgi:hypothetical protein
MINAHSAPEKLPELKGDSRDKLGELAGCSGKTYEHATKINRYL